MVYKWTKVTGCTAFAPRDGAGALTFKDSMWLVGGWNPKDKKNFPRHCSNDIWRSKDGCNWFLVQPNTYLDKSFNKEKHWAGRHTGGYTVHENAIWIVGGDANQGYHQGDIWASQDGQNWCCILEQAPWAPRVLHGTATYQGKIWVWGGQTMPGFAGGEEKFYDDIWVSANGRDWKRLEPKVTHWMPRGMVGGSVIFKNRLWILGGGTYDTPDTPERSYHNDVWSTADGLDWICHTNNAPWSPRQYHQVVVYDHKMWIFAGWNGLNLNDVWYSSDGVNWFELPDTPWPARHAASVFVHDEALWILAGSHMETDVWKLEQA